MKGLRTALLASFLFVALIVPALAQTPPAEVFYDLQPYGSGWKYSYTLRNNSFVDAYGGVSWFNTYFPATQVGGQYLYSNIDDSGFTPPFGWDSAGVLQPDLNRPPLYGGPRGTWGALTNAAGSWTPLKPGQSLGGFSVAFNYLGNDTPGFQEFEILDYDSGDVIFSGQTKLFAAVPSPTSIFLLAASLIGLAALRKKS